MNILKLSKNKQLDYTDNIILEYCIKITKTDYVNLSTNKCYSRCKIKVPSELKIVLENEDYLFFSGIDDKIHITVTEPSTVVHKAKIQKYCNDNRIEYNINLSKKVFNLDDGDYFYWRITVEDNMLIDSVGEIIKEDMLLKGS